MRIVLTNYVARLEAPRLTEIQKSLSATCDWISISLWAIQKRIERRKQSALFSDCRIIQTGLDLLGVLLCGGDIGAAGCYPDSGELEKRKRNKVRLFDLPQDLNPLPECIGFFFEMVPPGGELLVYARGFELV